MTHPTTYDEYDETTDSWSPRHRGQRIDVRESPAIAADGFLLATVVKYGRQVDRGICCWADMYWRLLAITGDWYIH